MRHRLLVVVVLARHAALLTLLCARWALASAAFGDGAGAAGGGAGSDRHLPPRQCQEVTIPMCKGIGYNMTYMPNQFNHDTQEEAGLEAHQFYPLVEIQCSPDLKFFLCSMYAPICVSNYHKPLPACRSVCERAKAGCAPLMRQYGFAWPERMRCEDLPEFGDKDSLCMDSNTSVASSGGGKPRPTSGGGGRLAKPGGSSRVADGVADASRRGKPPTNAEQPRLPASPSSASSPAKAADADSAAAAAAQQGGGGGGAGAVAAGRDCRCYCRSPLYTIADESSRYYNRVSTGGEANCAQSCDSAYFTPEERTFAAFWVGLWSVLCCVSTLMTVTTFLIDANRFEYPARPIIFLSGCYFMVSVGYIVRLVAGHEAVACDGGVVRYGTTGPAACTVVFLLIYFFGMASSIWWVVLTFTWFLAAGLKWGQEAIARRSQYFHLAAWLVPSVKSIAALALSSVDGDAVSGICYVGNQDVSSLRWFVLGPLCFYLLAGTTFLLAGFVSLFRIRNDVIRRQGRQKADKLEKLMIRIGVYSVLYTVPATVVIACYFYEQHFRSQWETAITCPCSSRARPDNTVFMLKYFMCLVVGITSGFWTWSAKTLESWRNFWAKLARRGVASGHAAGDGGKYSAVAYSVQTAKAGGGGGCQDRV